MAVYTQNPKQRRRQYQAPAQQPQGTAGAYSRDPNYDPTGGMGPVHPGFTPNQPTQITMPQGRAVTPQPFDMERMERERAGYQARADANPGMVQRDLYQMKYGGSGNARGATQAEIAASQQNYGRMNRPDYQNRSMTQGREAAFQRATKRRYGQVQGAGQGYMQPRQSLGGRHEPARARIGAGLAPRTAGRFGGRPRQIDAMTRQAFPATSYVRRPFGGTNAVPRWPQRRG